MHPIVRRQTLSDVLRRTAFRVPTKMAFRLSLIHIGRCRRKAVDSSSL